MKKENYLIHNGYKLLWAEIVPNTHILLVNVVWWVIEAMNRYLGLDNGDFVTVGGVWRGAFRHNACGEASAASSANRKRNIRQGL